MEGGGHTWPGNFDGWPAGFLPVNRDIDASEEIWKFFERHELAATTSNMPGDYNGEGLVSAADYTIYRNTIGSTTNLAPDGDNNGVVDTGDYATWKMNFTEPVGSESLVDGVVVPELASFWLLFGLPLVDIWRWRRKHPPARRTT